MGRAKTKQQIRFLKLPYSILHHQHFSDLSPRALKLLLEIAGQYNGYNNGDLIATKSYLSKRGWNRNDLINKAKCEPLGKGLASLI